MMMTMKEFLNEFKWKYFEGETSLRRADPSSSRASFSFQRVFKQHFIVFYSRSTSSSSRSIIIIIIISDCIQVALHPARSFQELFIHENCRVSYLSILTLKTDHLFIYIPTKQLLESKCCSRSPCPVLRTRTSIADINCVHRNSLSRYHPFVHPSASSSSRSRYHEHHPSNLNFCNCATNLWWFSHGWRVVKKQEEVITSSCFLTTLQLWLLYSSSFLLRVFSGS